MPSKQNANGHWSQLPTGGDASASLQVGPHALHLPGQPRWGPTLWQVGGCSEAGKTPPRHSKRCVRTSRCLMDSYVVQQMATDGA